MVSSEDFIFPKITSPLIPHFATSSPSLWRVSSVVYPDLNWDGDGDDGYGYGGGGGRVSEAKEEKMDMLWEDFNEEVQRVSSLGTNNKKNKKIKKMMMMKNCHSSAGGDEYQYHDDKSVELVKSGHLYQARSSTTNKKQSLGSMFKLVKKMFLIHNSNRS